MILNIVTRHRSSEKRAYDPGCENTTELARPSLSREGQTPKACEWSGQARF